jgi:hypothetical protein
MKIILIALVVISGATVSRAQSFDANLDPFQEVPPHNTPGYGSADFTLSGTNLSIDVGTGVYADLLAGATVVRLQDAAVGANGPTLFTFNLDTPGNTSGTFSGFGYLTASQVTDLQNGSLYVNIADSVYPGGEIRGQLLAAPEPTTVALLGTGLLGLLVVRRRKA